MLLLGKSLQLINLTHMWRPVHLATELRACTHHARCQLSKCTGFSSPQHSRCRNSNRDRASSSPALTLTLRAGTRRKHNGDFLFANTCCSPAVTVSPSPFSLIQNGFLLITIILKVLKHINRWLSLAYKGASRLAFMALSNSSWYFIQRQIQFGSYKRVSIPEKILGLIWCSESAHAPGHAALPVCLLPYLDV